jgi:TRAP-type uncharacterized transport system fused permease subunit
MMMAWKYTLPAFVVPFMFTIHASGLGLLLQAPAQTVIAATATAVFGLIALAAAITGWFLRRATWLERAVLAAAGVILIYPAGLQDAVAAAAVVGVAVVQWFTRQPSPRLARP